MVIATVFLTIIGMTAGFVLGERHRRTLASGTTEPTVQPSASASAIITLTGASCPPETRQSAAELDFPDDLRQVLKIETDNGTTVWICTDAYSRYYYQSKTQGVDSPLIQGQNGLFLFQVTKLGVDDYVGIDDKGTRIEVTRKQLVVRRTNGKTEVYPVSSSK